METRFERFLAETVPDSSIREDMRRFLGAHLILGVPLESINFHGSFDEPCQDSGGFSPKVGE